MMQLFVATSPPSVKHSTDTNWPILQLTSLGMHTGGCSEPTPSSPTPFVLKKARGPATSKVATKCLLSSVCKPRRDILITFHTTLACADCWGAHTAHFLGILYCIVLCCIVLYCIVLCHLILHYSFIFSPIHCNVSKQSVIQHVMLLLRFQSNSSHYSVTLLQSNSSHCSVTLLQSNSSHCFVTLLQSNSSHCSVILLQSNSSHCFVTLLQSNSLLEQPSPLLLFFVRHDAFWWWLM
jgi:hypothetical protein